MLRASHRVLTPGGTTAFYVIVVSEAATGTEREQAIRAGPPHVDTDLPYPDLMNAAGLDHVEVDDVTPEYLATLTAWWREWDVGSVELAAVVGEEAFAERQANRMRAMRSVQGGLLRRYLISGTRT